MKVELHINGRLNIELTPETTIEKTVLAEIIEHATKGKAVRIDASTRDNSGTTSMTVSVEK